MDRRIQLIDGIFLTVGSYAEILGGLIQKITEKKSFILLPCSLNDVASCNSEYFKCLYSKIEVLTTDGMPLVWYSKYVKKIKEAERVYGPELMVSLLNSSLVRSYTHKFIGPSQTTNQLLEKKLALLHILPKKSLFITAPKPCTSSDWEYLSNNIKFSKRSICWIGLSSPVQIELAVYLQSKHPATTFFCVGAAFDIVSGTATSAPKLMQGLGLEWLFRLIAEPKRLSKRYLYVIPISLLKLFLFKRKL